MSQTAVVAPRLDSDLQRQLMRSRRRGEDAAVLVARSKALPRAATEDLLGTLRATDGFEVATHGPATEIRAVLDASGLDRDAVERRVRSVTADTGTEFGWAQFPGDGVTLNVLIDHARKSLVPAAWDERNAEPLMDSAAGIGAPAPTMAKAS
jgi:hypothetical protein